MQLRRATASLLALSLAGCYVYGPAASQVRGGQEVQVFLNDRGRAELGKTVGAGTRTLSGAVVQAADSSVVLAVSGTRSIDGAEYEWTGEHVSIPRSLFDSVRVRRASVARTALLTAAVVGAAALVHTAFGTGANGGTNPTPAPAPK